MTISADESTRKALAFQKSTFACWYDAVSAMQDRTTTAVDTFLNETTWIPDEGRKVISSWVSSCKNERERYKVYMDESFSVLEKHMSANKKKDPPSRSDKPAEAKTAASEIKSKEAAVEEKKAPVGLDTKQSIQ